MRISSLVLDNPCPAPSPLVCRILPCTGAGNGSNFASARATWSILIISPKNRSIRADGDRWSRGINHLINHLSIGEVILAFAPSAGKSKGSCRPCSLAGCLPENGPGRRGFFFRAQTHGRFAGRGSQLGSRLVFFGPLPCDSIGVSWLGSVPS